MTYDLHFCLQWLEKINLAKNGTNSWTIIFYNFRRGLSGQECSDELKSLFADKAPSYSTVKNWLNEFNCGRRSLKDKYREGRAKTAVVSDNIDALRELTMQDHHVTYREIEAFLDIFPSSYIQYCMNIWPWKRPVLVGSRTIWSALKKLRLEWCKKNVAKIGWRCLKRRL